MNDDLRAGSIAATITAACVAVLVAAQISTAPDYPQHVLANVCQGGACMLCEAVLLADSKQSTIAYDTCQPVQPSPPLGKLGGRLQPLGAADKAAAIKAIAQPDSLDFITGDDARAQAGCACAPWSPDPADPDPCMWTHGVPMAADTVTEPAPRDMAMKAGEWSGNCVPTMCLEFNQMITLQGFRYATPDACKAPVPPDGGTP